MTCSELRKKYENMEVFEAVLGSMKKKEARALIEADIQPSFIKTRMWDTYRNAYDKHKTKLPCPCCGNKTLEKDPAEKSCIVCGWYISEYADEYADEFGPDDIDYDHDLSLNVARMMFKKYGDNVFDHIEEWGMMDGRGRLCPVCGKYKFPGVISSEVCPFCNWFSDIVQEDDPDFWGGENQISLNQAREAYKRGEKVM